MEVEAAVHALARQVEVEGAEAGDAAHLRVDRGLHQRADDRRVDRVAAVPERQRAGLDGLGLGRADHAVGHEGSPPGCGLGAGRFVR